MLKKTAEPGKVNRSIRLSETPGLAEIDQFLTQSIADDQVGKTVEVRWFTPDKKIEFMLEVISHQRGGEPEWRFSQTVDGQLVHLWTYVSCDMLLIHNLILTTCGESHKSVAGEGKILKATDYRQVYKMPSSYYTSSIDTLEKEHDKAKAGTPQETKELAGDLSGIDLSSLLNSMRMSKLSGRLTVKGPTDEAELFFDDGNLVHARCQEATGEECVLVICTWRSGSFNFEPGVKSDRKTIREGLEKLLLKGVLLLDKQNYLDNCGVTPESILLRNRRDLAEAEFESISQAAASGSYLSYDMTFQKNFYLVVDDKSTLQEVITRLNLMRSQWVPLLVRMMKCRFISLQNPPVKAQPQAVPKTIDRNAILSVMTVLKRPETGLLTYPAFLYFLEQEFLRHHRLNKPMSVVVIEMRVSDDSPNGTHQPLPPAILGEVVRRVSALKRDVDYLAHYEMFDLAAILPDTNSDGAYIFTERIMASLFGDPLDQHFGESQFSLSMGIATVPTDAGDLRTLLGAAEAARKHAQRLERHALKYEIVKQPTAT